MSPAMTNAAITLANEAEIVMGSLCDLLDRETEAVRASDFDAFRNLQNDKFTMLTRYKSLVETLDRQRDTVKNSGEAVAKRLKVTLDRFRASSQRNAVALEAGSNSMRRITDRIVRSARETVHANRQVYNSKGVSGPGKQVPLSIKIDEVL